MFKNLLLISLFIGVSILNGADKYVCKTSPQYKDYLEGKITDLNTTGFYDNFEICENNCRDYKGCVVRDTNDLENLITSQNTLNKDDVARIEDMAKGKLFSKIEINSDGEYFAFEINPPIFGTTLTFPKDKITSGNNDEIVKKVYESSGGYIKFIKIPHKSLTEPLCNNGDVMEFKKCYKDVGEFEITETRGCFSPNMANGDTCIVRESYNPTRCIAPAFYRKGQCAEFGDDTAKYSVEVSQVGRSTKRLEEGSFTDPLTGSIMEKNFIMNGYTNTHGFTCNPLRGTLKDGDLGANYFSTKQMCESYCFLQNECTSASLNTSNCVVTDESLSHPVTDWTGKTVFTKSSRTILCKTETQVQSGCDEYKVSNNFGSVSFDTSSVGWRYSTYDGLEDASSHILMTEQLQHLFSGWAGYCEYGTKFNNPFNDPMKILSYAMMAYSAAGQGTFGENIKETVGNMNQSFIKAANKISTEAGFGNIIEASSGASGTSIFEEWNNIKDFEVLGAKLTLKWTALAEAALAIAFPPKDEFIKADNLLKTWMGGSSADNAALAYASCMASIGLSFPNLVSWSGNDEEGMSYQLKEPHNNPIRLTDNQMSILIAATALEFVKVGLLPIKEHNDGMTYIATSPLVYIQVGQVICGGKLAVAQNIINQESTSTESSNGGADYGMIAAKLVISMLPPPANLIGSLILDIVTSFESKNACSSQEDALQWGMLQFKTNQHMNFGQCHQTGSKCVAKWFWGSCMRSKNEYCCYDQISTRIMMEGLKEQLGRSWDNCSDISINDFKNINLTPCKVGQDPFRDKCFPRGKYDEFVNMMMTQASKGLSTMGMQDLIDQSINSMAIPGRSLEDMCEDCN